MNLQLQRLDLLLRARRLRLDRAMQAVRAAHPQVLKCERALRQEQRQLGALEQERAAGRSRQADAATQVADVAALARQSLRIGWLAEQIAAQRRVVQRSEQEHRVALAKLDEARAAWRHAQSRVDALKEQRLRLAQRALQQRERQIERAETERLAHRAAATPRSGV